ncbi:competence type IV pilus minor pilin ComGD [Aliibacillus thermotolerans]|uniref:Competence type IV pilus minor pilin ComGD n=1 Tax=Aliibacillus thermotolerans TaxID=1834418 RepID=A0ABW0U8Q7_9BACI
MILVLLLLSVFLLLPMLSFSSLSEKTRIDQFLNIFSEDIRFAQQYAYAHETVVYFRFRGNEYEVRASGRTEPLIARPVMKSVAFHPFTMSPNEIRFNSKGNVSKAGTIHIETPKKRYRLVFLIGRGGFYIE